MSNTTLDTRVGAEPATQANGGPASATADLGAAARQAFWLLRIGFTVAPILFGVDKFFNWSVHWPDYLAGWVNNIIPGSGQDWMHVVGGIEIAAGLLVAVAPPIGALAGAGWPGWCVIHPLTKNPPQ